MHTPKPRSPDRGTPPLVRTMTSAAEAAPSPRIDFDDEEEATLPYPERIQQAQDSNPPIALAPNGTVMWAGPTPNGVGARSTGPLPTGTAGDVTGVPSAE